MNSPEGNPNFFHQVTNGAVDNILKDNSQQRNRPVEDGFRHAMAGVVVGTSILGSETLNATKKVGGVLREGVKVTLNIAGTVAEKVERSLLEGTDQTGRPVELLAPKQPPKGK